MPRQPRIAPSEYVYHVLTRGNNRMDIFHEKADFIRYLGILKKYKEKHSFRLYHYALMTNHVHLVLEPTPAGGTLAEIMKVLNLSYAQYYKQKYGHIGHFWQDRFKSIIISTDRYLLTCGSYVELNPVRAGIVERPKDYEWSSYRVYAYGSADGITDQHPIYEGLASEETERRKWYREFVREWLQKGALKGEMDRKVVYGSEDFSRKVKKRHAISAVIQPRGRPKKRAEEEK